MLCAVSLFLVVAACARPGIDQGPDGEPELLHATLGVFNTGDEQRLLVLLLPPDGQTDAALQYSISGPPGWNLDAPLMFQLTPQQLSAGTALIALPAPWAAGDFTIDMQLAKKHQAEVSMPAAPLKLDPPGNMALAAASAASVSASWDAVTGATSYSARLQRAADGSAVASVVATDPMANFGDLELEPGGYLVQLDAFSFDPETVGTGDAPELPEAGSFGWSRSLSGTMVVAASSTACLPGSAPIADANLGLAVQAALGLATQPRCADLLELRVLTGGSADTVPISSLAGLEFAVNMSQLIIERHPIDSVATLAQHPTLDYLNLANSTLLTDLGPLAGLPALRTVILSGSAVTDFSVLSSLPLLESLHLNGHGLVTADLAFLADLPQLVALHLNTNGIDSLEPLAGLHNLEVLVVSANPLNNLAPVAGRAYRHLDFSSTAVPAADALNFVSNLVAPGRLERLGIVGLGISATDLFAAGSDFTSLHSLYLSDNLFTNLPDLKGLAALELLLASRNPLSQVSDLEMLFDVFNGREPDVYRDFAVYLTDNAMDTCDAAVAEAAAQLQDLGVLLYMDPCVPAP